jgi:hypothetical protein
MPRGRSLTINNNYVILSANERAKCRLGTYCYEAKPISGVSPHHAVPTGRLFYYMEEL